MSVPPTAPAVVAPLGPAAAVASLPSLVLPCNRASTAFWDITRRTKSEEEPPTWSPTLAPPIEYMAGADHGPLKFLPVRQTMGPRPPLPPIPTPNFFTLGRTTTQSARASTSVGTFLPSIIDCNTVAAFRSVSSSFDLSAAQAANANSMMKIVATNRFMTLRVGNLSSSMWGKPLPSFPSKIICSTLRPAARDSLTQGTRIRMVRWVTVILVLASLAAQAQTASFDDEFRKGLVALQRKDLAVAQESLERASQLQPENPKVWVALAQVYLGSKQMDQANAAAKRAESLAADDPVVQHALAIFFSGTGDFAKAAEMERQ